MGVISLFFTGAYPRNSRARSRPSQTRPRPRRDPGLRGHRATRYRSEGRRDDPRVIHPRARLRAVRGDDGARQGLEERRAEADHPHGEQQGGGRGAGPRSARRADPPGHLLRHPRPRPQPGRRRGALPPHPGQGRRLRREAATGRAGDLPDELCRLETFGIEVDAMPGGFVCSASYKGVADAEKAKLVSFKQAPVHKAFNREQRAFYKVHAPEGLELDDLTVLGPIFVVKVPFTPKIWLTSWSLSSGSTRTGAASSSSPRRAPRRTCSRSTAACATSSSSAASTVTASSRPRPSARSSTSSRT